MSIVFVGVWWSGMNALARLFIDMQIPWLVGIDAAASPETETLQTLGMPLVIWHGKHLPIAGDLVIYSAATLWSPEVQAAFAHTTADHQSPPPMLYAEVLGEISKYLYTIAISGTHGKSTTTSMIAHACISHIPAMTLAIVGAGVTAWDGASCRHAPSWDAYLRQVLLHIVSPKATDAPSEIKKHLFVVEADEFNHHFLRLHPDVSVIPTLDHDHVDIYPTRASYFTAFWQFFDNTTEACFLPLPLRETLTQVPRQSRDEKFHFVSPRQFHFFSALGGHNHTNASLAHAVVMYVAQQQGVACDTQALDETFDHRSGIKRRAELIGKNIDRDVSVFSDYGHHPAEIGSTLDAFIQTYPWVSLTCIFEPHQARRLLEFRDEFVWALQKASVRVTIPVYAARERREDLAEIIQKKCGSTVTDFDSLNRFFAQQADAQFIATDETLEEYVSSLSHTIVIGFSAGRLDSVLRKLVKE